MLSSKPIIKINNLNVTYFPGKQNEVKALKSINLEIFPGEFIIFFGPSGCGKSTLLYSIAGLETNITGDIFINEKNIAKLQKKDLEDLHQKTIGMVFQAYYLIGSLSVIKNVILPSVAIGGDDADREKRALSLLQHFGVEKQAYKYPNELSGGQQQRVAISRSLMNDPEIILADEPVGNLDSKAAEDVVSLLKELNRKEKKTVILVTHNPAFLSIADRVFFIKDGELTKVETNKATDMPTPAAQAQLVSGENAISKDLALLERTFSNISGAVGSLLTPFKAKQIVSEALTEMSQEEIELIEKKVEGLLMSGSRNSEDGDVLFKFLDNEIEKGGFGMNKQTALNLSSKIKKMVDEIKILEQRDQDVKSGKAGDKDGIERVRNYLLSAFDIKSTGVVSVKFMDEAIRQRLENKIDKTGFNKKIDLPIKKGGAGLDKRTARKIARRLELLILGKYK